MRKEIEEIYQKNLELIKQSEWIIYYFRIQNLDAALRRTVAILDGFMGVLPLYLQEGNYFNEDRVRYTQEGLMGICQLLLEAQEKKDYILLADYYELHFLPFLYDLQEKIAMDEGGVPETFDADKYAGIQVEYTGCGAMTIRKSNGVRVRYLHSNKSPYKEALELALSWYSEEKEEYIIYGLGLGYHVAALFELDNSISISVYESDEKIIELSKMFGMGEILERNPNIQIHNDKNLEKILKKVSSMKEESTLVIHEPSLDLVSVSSAKEWLEEYFLKDSSIKSQSRLLNGNFRRNVREVRHCIDELKSEFAGKTIYLIGAGPSLDKNFMELKNVPENSIILSTGTAFRKLINNEIRPDYVIETDANERIRWHFRNVENETIPMLLLSTATYELVKRYAGEKYLIFQKDYQKAEDFVANNSVGNAGYTLYETGGSVMTAALDIGIQMGCKKVVFLGLDLAYTDNYAHASGTSRREIPKENDGLKQIEDINGNLVLTNKPFNIYRKWIESRIEREKNSDIQFIDATEGGAKIKGTNIKTLKEVLTEEP